METQPQRMRRSTDDITTRPPLPSAPLAHKVALRNVNDEALCSFVACSLATIFDFDGAVVGYEANRIYDCWMLPQLALTRGERERDRVSKIKLKSTQRERDRVGEREKEWE